ncbi:transcription termination/antitermination protein NusA [bacterium]|nr:transcription termination/antitermination protein NusA [bacterium]|tara:strand:- start:7530 stop:8882 length:1353 start_codon:yes stop_codon:yes gene_type:complete
MFDLKVLNSALLQLEEEKGIPKTKILGAIEDALAAAYKKDYGKKGQIVKAKFDPTTGKVDFFKVKVVVDESMIRDPEEDEEVGEPEVINEDEEGEKKVLFNEEHHIWLPDAQKIKADVELGEEIVFPLEQKEDYGRIAAQTAKQVIIQRLREAEKVSVLDEFSQKKGEIVTGSVQRVERGNVLIDLGRITALLPRDEQIPGEYYRQGERIKTLLLDVVETGRGVDLRLSRSHPDFLVKLFEIESPEIANGTVEVGAIAREAGSRSKIAVVSNDENIDPVGSLVGQRGIRVNTVINELGGEKIDIIEYSDDPETFITQALSPAKVISVETTESENEEEAGSAKVEVEADQFSLAIGKGGQNVRLAAKLTGWKIDIEAPTGEQMSATEDGETTGDVEEKDNQEQESETTEEPNETEVTEEEKKEEEPAEEKKEESSEETESVEENKEDKKEE